MGAVEFYTETWRDVCDEYSTSLCWRRGDESGVMATLDDAPDDVLAAMLGALEGGPSAATILDICGPMPDTELTAYPYWIIVDPSQNMRRDPGRMAMATFGPFFSREEATEHFNATRYRYSDRAVVWCGSGHMSLRWRALCDARQGKGATSLHAEALEAAGVDTAEAMTDRELIAYLLDRLSRGRGMRWANLMAHIHNGSTVCSALLTAAGLDPDEVVR